MGIFKGGMSCEFEVAKLMKAIDVTAGLSVSYQDVKKICDLDPKTNRFRTVTQSWRKRIWKEKLIECRARDEMFHFLTPDEAHDTGKQDVHRIGRATGRLAIRMEAVDEELLSSQERKSQHALMKREVSATLDSIRKSAKAIAAPKPVVGVNLRIAK